MGGFQARSQLICAEFRSLFSHATRLVQCRDGTLIQIPLRIETPVRRNENHCPKRRQIRCQLEEQWAIPPHSIQKPSLTKHIENRMKAVCGFPPAKGAVLAHATLGDEPA